MGNSHRFLRNSFVLCIGLILSLTALLTGCSGNKSSEPAAEKVEKVEKAANITLKVYATTQMEFDDRFTPALRGKFPNITFENVPHDLGFVPGLQQLIVSNDIPDLLLFANGSMDMVLPLNVLADINPYMKKYSVKLQLAQGVMDNVTSYSSKGEFLAMPISNQPGVLLYNKNVFDRFGMEYPKDGMTWDQAYNLSRKLTRTEGKVSYLGFDYINYIWFNNQLSLPTVDPKTNKSAFNTTGWKDWIENLHRFFQIPGNEFIANPSAESRFVKDKNIAMLATQTLWAQDSLIKSDIDWDMVTLPTFADHPETGQQLAFVGAGIANQSQHKDEAFQVISYMLSDEYQEDIAKGGAVPINNNPTVIKHFGENTPSLKVKNTQALFKLKIAARPTITPYNLQARQVITPMIQEIMSGKTDVVTGLREGEEKINKAIEAPKKE